jgi:phosphoribosylamine--glycine ligase
VYYAPGCVAITDERITSLPHLSLSDPDGMASFAVEREVDLVFVANANALGDGFVDVFRGAGLPVVGPDRAAARLESSKSYTKQLCRRHGVPTAGFAVFDTADEARAYAAERDCPLVVKADGLCGGNGRFICFDAAAARSAIDALMVERVFNAAGDRVVIEDYLDGRECLFFVLVDSNGGYRMLPMAVDYPHSDDGNTGVTCGGMGAFSPHPGESPELVAAFQRQILLPLLQAVRGEGLTFSGVMYVGAMLVDDQFYLLEVNARMGEPEAEVILPRLHSDFYAISVAMLDGGLERLPELDIDDRVLCNVVATQGPTRQISGGRSKGWYKGWPYGRHGKNYPITGVEKIDPLRCKVFLGQVRVDPEKGLVTDGGRCVHVVGEGADLAEAARNAYTGMGFLDFNGIRYRCDIGRLMPWDRPTDGIAG